VRRIPPALERAVRELRESQDRLADLRHAQLDLAEQIRQMDERHRRDRESVVDAYRRITTRGRELQLAHDLRAQEVGQLQVKVATLEQTYRRYQVQRDDLALRDAVDIARQLGIRPGELADYL